MALVDLYFLARGANVRAVNASGCTPLHDAVKRGDVQAVTELLMHNSDPMAKVTCGLVILSVHIMSSNYLVTLKYFKNNFYEVCCANIFASQG